MMKNFPFKALVALLLVSCSNSDIFNENSKSEFEFEIFYETFIYRDELYIYAYPYSLDKYGEEYDYYWVIDGERFYGQYLDRNISYGEHFLEFVLIDSFGDTLSESGVIRVNEPLKITLLSPVNGYEAAITDTIIYQYKINGVDAWEKLHTLVDTLWVNDSVYSWRVKAFTEQDTVVSEERRVCIKK